MVFVVIWIVCAAIVGMIASNKGFPWLGWAIYGFLIFPVALVHVLIKPSLVNSPSTQAKTAEATTIATAAAHAATQAAIAATPPKSQLEQLTELNALRQSGAITDDEFQTMKAKVLAS